MELKRPLKIYFWRIVNLLSLAKTIFQLLKWIFQYMDKLMGILKNLLSISLNDLLSIVVMLIFIISSVVILRERHYGKFIRRFNVLWYKTKKNMYSPCCDLHYTFLSDYRPPDKDGDGYFYFTCHKCLKESNPRPNKRLVDEDGRPMSLAEANKKLLEDETKEK